MKSLLKILALLFIVHEANAASLPKFYTELVPYVQPAPDQGETGTCWFVASTGAMELLLNKQHNIKKPKVGGPFDLAESFIIHQADYYDPSISHFLQDIVMRFNFGEAVHISEWPYQAYYEDGTDNYEVWDLHPNFDSLPRMKVPRLKSELLFAKGSKYSTYVLEPSDITLMKETLLKRRSPLIVNYNDDGYWHVVLIVGYHDKKMGDCYELEKDECNPKGAFFVRDSNGKKFEMRAYDWFLKMGNSAAIVELE